MKVVCSPGSSASPEIRNGWSIVAKKDTFGGDAFE